MASLRPISILFLFCFTHSLCFENINCDCTLVATSGSSSQFNETLTAKTRFLYLKLNFLDVDFNSTEFAYLQNTLDVIDPLTWVLSVGGNGKLLLQSPFDFKYVSLGTLSASGVGSVDIDIITPECFTGDISDEEKLCSIVDLLYSLTIDAINNFQSKTNDLILQVSSFKVCLEKQSAKRRYIFRNKNDRTVNLLERMSESAHGILQSTPEYSCWVANDTTEMITPTPIIIPRDRTNWWFRWLLNIVATFIVLFSPYLFFKYFDWQNPPKDNKIRIDTRPYPFGFFHFVFYSTFLKCDDLCSLSCWLRYIFFFLLMAFLCCIQFLPYLYVDPNNYSLRKLAAERMDVWKFDWGNRYLTYFCVTVIMVNIILYNCLKFSITRRQMMNNDEATPINDIGKSYLTTKWIFPQTDDKDIVAEICPEKGGDIFIDSPKVWNLLKVLKKTSKGSRSTCTKIFLVPIILAFWIGQVIPLIYYTNIVLAVIIALVHNSCNKKRKNELDDGGIILQDGEGRIEEMARDKEQKIQDVLLLYLIFIPSFGSVFFLVTVPVFFQMFIGCSHLIEVVGYTLVGFIVNAKYVVAWIVFALGIVSFMAQTVTGYTNSYVTLFYEIFDVSESVASKLDHPIVSRDTDGVPQIGLNFFLILLTE
ncbi:uncharacterized protein [Amphiura filiformis]|uniref:uncharacterized protein n=1 Tax=Amphiura filiformis TaxID=82378 RepID=UPI003B221C62